MSLQAPEMAGFQKCNRRAHAVQRAMAAATVVMAGSLMLALIVVTTAVLIDLATSPNLL